MNNLDKLNRLRVNAGKTELKSWKASQAKLDEAVAALEKAGAVDVVPGANVEAKPKTDDPVIAKNLPEEEKTPEAEEPKPPTPEVKKQKAQLARGLETEGMARQSRYAVQAMREQERKEAAEERKKTKAEKKAEKKAAKSEQKIAGKVDAKKDPAKAKRQEQHVKDKQAARAGKPKVEKNDNEITVADIARELDIDPKVARAKLRRHEDKISKLHTKGQDRWVFPKSAKAELVKILK
mgnify:CR=1 FL=1